MTTNRADVDYELLQYVVVNVSDLVHINEVDIVSTDKQLTLTIKPKLAGRTHQ
jgi:hypothetical protein